MKDKTGRPPIRFLRQGNYDDLERAGNFTWKIITLSSIADDAIAAIYWVDGLIDGQDIGEPADKAMDSLNTTDLDGGTL